MGPRERQRSAPRVQARVDLESAFQTREEVAAHFSESGISVDRPAASRGLTLQRAAEQLEVDGANELTPGDAVSPWTLLAKQMINPFMILLAAAGVLSFVAYGIDPSQTLNAVLGGVLFFVVAVTILMSWSQEVKTIKTMAGFSNILPTEAIVIRDGTRTDVLARTLVVGDLVVLTLGQKVPADVRLLSTSMLKVENGAITGESEPVELDAAATYTKGEMPVEEARNIAFNGSLVLDGEGLGVVVATGDRTLLGHIAKLTSQTETRRSTMEIEVQRFVYFISVLAISMAIVFFVIDVARRSGEGALNSFINGFLVIIVANVPQGLPATVTSLQLIVAKRLAKKNVFVKRLDAVETLGAVSVICSDKTGTLTMNKMTVVNGWINSQIGLQYFAEALIGGLQHSAVGDQVSGMRQSTSAVVSSEPFYEKALSSVILIQIIATVCNNAISSMMAPTSGEDGKDIEVAPQQSDFSMTSLPVKVAPVSFKGNPSEVALLNFFEGFRSGIVAQLRSLYPVVLQIPFNSKNKYHVVVVKGSLRPEQQSTGRNVHSILMKGAPEMLLRRCSRYVKDNIVHEIDKDFSSTAMEAYAYFARHGQRVLGFCTAEFEGEAELQTLPLERMTFVGMLAIQDPPRPDVPNAIVRCRQAGIKVFMVTGDHEMTAAAIAVQIGLLPDNVGIVHYEAGMCAHLRESRDPVSVVIHGQQVDRFDDDDWNFVLMQRNLVFARTTPQNKLTITIKCQERKELVCMTGDGVNDAPALKRADIGVAMGINGSEVAREASDVILMDDNFASIVLGVEAGRVLFDNLKKTIAYTLCHLAPEIVPVLLTLAFGFPPLLSSLQILSVDLFTELAPAISLAYEPRERDVMEQAPRNLQRDRLVSAPLLTYAYLWSGVAIEAVACFIAACIVFWTYGIPIPTIAFSFGSYFIPSNPFVIVPGWGNLCTGSVCYTPDQQVSILQQAAGAWYIVLISSQVLHIWMVKTRRVSLFQHDVLGNMVMNFGVLLEACLMIIFVGVPGLNTGLMSAKFPPGLAALPIIYSFVALWVFNEGRKWYIRHHRKSLFARIFFW